MDPPPPRPAPGTHPAYYAPTQAAANPTTSPELSSYRPSFARPGPLDPAFAAPHTSSSGANSPSSAASRPRHSLPRMSPTLATAPLALAHPESASLVRPSASYAASASPAIASLPRALSLPSSLPGPSPHVGAHSPFPIPPDSRVAHGVAGMITAKRRELLSVFRQPPSDQNTLNDMAASSVLQSLAAPVLPSLAGVFAPRRCYWLICELSEDNQRAPCLFLDPTLTQHLGSEASRVVGSSIIGWIHPQEASLCRRDLQEIVASKRISGSITRCRMNRITAIRRALGNLHPPVPDVAAALDQYWTTVHLISNWIGGNRLLIFVHNCMKVPNDLQSEETDPAWWTHRCGMEASALSPYELDVLWQACMMSEPPRSLQPAGAPSCIFQILGFGTGEILFSWPPPRLFSTQAEADKHKPGTFHTYTDGSYFADDLARLVQGVSLPPRSTAPLDEDDDQPETSCTRRFHATHTFVSCGVSHAVESVVVPYGQIMFACFRVVTETSPVSATTDMIPPVTPALTVGPGPTGGASVPENASPWGSSAAVMKPNLTAEGAAGGMSPSPAESWPSVITSRPTPQPVAPPGPPPISGSGEWDATLPTDARRRKRGAGSMDGEDGTDSRAARRRHSRLGSAGEGVEKVCTSCGTRSSPEWRKGPGGRKSLCNACGLRFSRQIQRQQKLLEAAYAQGGEDALNRASAALGQAEGVAEAAAAVLKRAVKKRVADATRPASRPLNPSVSSNPPPAPLGPGPAAHGAGPGSGPMPGHGAGVETASPSPTVFSNRGVSNASSDTAAHTPSSHPSHPSHSAPLPPAHPTHSSHSGGGYGYDRDYRAGGHTSRPSLTSATAGYAEYPKFADPASSSAGGSGVSSYDYPVSLLGGTGAGASVAPGAEHEYDPNPYYRPSGPSGSPSDYYRRPPQLQRATGPPASKSPASIPSNPSAHQHNNTGHGHENGHGNGSWMPLLRSPHLPTSY